MKTNLNINNNKKRIYRNFKNGKIVLSDSLNQKRSKLSGEIQNQKFGIEQDNTEILCFREY
jgi:hypothetical protein